MPYYKRFEEMYSCVDGIVSSMEEKEKLLFETTLSKIATERFVLKSMWFDASKHFADQDCRDWVTLQLQKNTQALDALYLKTFTQAKLRPLLC